MTVKAFFLMDPTRSEAVAEAGQLCARYTKFANSTAHSNFR
jgi:hypothetical protein